LPSANIVSSVENADENSDVSPGSQTLRRMIASEAKVIGELRGSGRAHRRKEAEPEALEADLAFIVISDSPSPNV
jgi:hypothetical protein